jgi:hypothetical protein
MEAQQDFRELLELFNRHAVEYVLVGAHALAFHGVPRYTGDLDIFLRPAAENAEKASYESLHPFARTKTVSTVSPSRPCHYMKAWVKKDFIRTERKIEDRVEV